MIKIKALLIKRYLKKQNIDFYVKSIKCKSTNNFAKATPLNRDGVYITKRQKDGRGRGEKSFLSGNGGLYLSVVLLRDISLIKLYHYPLISALATVDALMQQGITANIKWPNDIIINNKKLGGILCESKSQSNNIIIGIGLNIKNNINALDNIAISLKKLGKKVCYHKLVGDIIKNILLYESMVIGEFLHLYRKKCISIGKEITISETGERGTAVDIDKDGYLLLNISGNIVRLLNPTD